MALDRRCRISPRALCAEPDTQHRLAKLGVCDWCTRRCSGAFLSGPAQRPGRGAATRPEVLPGRSADCQPSDSRVVTAQLRPSVYAWSQAWGFKYHWDTPAKARESGAAESFVRSRTSCSIAWAASIGSLVLSNPDDEPARAAASWVVGGRGRGGDAGTSDATCWCWSWADGCGQERCARNVIGAWRDTSAAQQDVDAPTAIPEQVGALDIAELGCSIGRRRAPPSRPHQSAPEPPSPRRPP